MDVYLSVYKDGEKICGRFCGVAKVKKDWYDRYEVKVNELNMAYLYFYRGNEVVMQHFLMRFQGEEYDYLEVEVYGDDDYAKLVETDEAEDKYFKFEDDDNDDDDDEWTDMAYDRWKEDMDNKLQQDNYGYDEVDQ